MKKCKLTLYIIGGGLLIYGLALLLWSGPNAGFYALIGIGMVLLAGGKFYQNIPTWIKFSVLTGLALWIGFVVFLFGYGRLQTVDYREDAVIVLGAGLHGDEPSKELKSRLDCAILYYEKNPDALIIVSGGLGDREQISEAEAMAQYLLDAGLPKSKIFKEDQSRNTYENLTFSKKILDNHLDSGYRIAIISNEFHLFRAGLIAADVGFEKVNYLYGTTPIVSILPCGLRECLALVKYIMF